MAGAGDTRGQFWFAMEYVQGTDLEELALQAMLARHGLDAAERAAIFGGTAARFYRLPGWNNSRANQSR